MKKRCPNCRAEKPLESFGVRKRSPSGRKSWCRECESAGQQQRYQRRVVAHVCIQCGRQESVGGSVLCAGCAARRAQWRARLRAAGVCKCGESVLRGRSRCSNCLARERRRYLVNDSGLCDRDYLHLMEMQQEACAICRRRCATGRRLAVDQDHATGRVRGLLCFRCNTSLARYEEYTREFAEYLSRTVVPITAHIKSARIAAPWAERPNSDLRLEMCDDCPSRPRSVEAKHTGLSRR